MELTPQIKYRLLLDMMRVRAFETETRKLFANNRIPGFLHTCIGEEAVPVGVCVPLEPSDMITSTHRGHGHCVAKGMEMKRMFAELMGKRDGCCGGRGGSMHMADATRGVLGANGIVGGGLPIATGAAFAARYLKDGRVSVCFFGDGALAQGSFHESVNIATIWKLPVIFLCENNQYGEYMHYTTQHGIERLADAAIAYGLPGKVVDGMDVLAVYQATCEAVALARRGGGPTLLEVITHRFVGHYEGDPEAYRTKEEIAEIMKLDPIPKLRNSMLKEGALNEQEWSAMEQRVKFEVQEAIAFAENSPLPVPESAVNDVFCN